MVITLLLALLQPALAAEEPVAPYVQSPANAGGRPARGNAMFDAFHGEAGIARIVDDLVATNQADPRIGAIFKGQDMVRLRRTLKEQFCYLLGGTCRYTGRTMAASHKDLGIQAKDMNALVENLQAAMVREHVAFPHQNAFLAKLAQMRRDVVTR